MEIDVPMIDHLLSTTRSVRRRLDLSRQVPTEIIRDCVRLAIQAPSAADVQNWRWVAVTDSRRRTAIADIHGAGNEEYAEGQVERLPDGPARRRMASALHLIRQMQKVPVHVLVYALDPELEGLDAKNVPPALLYGSVFPAVWSFQLALRARGLGTAPIYVADQAAVNEVVGAPQSAHIACLLPVAFFTGSTFQPARRRPVDEVLSWDQWNWMDPPAGAVSQAGAGWRSRGTT